MFSVYSPVLHELSQLVLDTFNAEKNSVKASQKDKHDYVTNVDNVLQSKIIRFLNSKFPEHDACGEEAMPKELELAKPTWVIDPLDGTSNFLFDVPFYGCSLALIVEGGVKVAFVMDFINQEVFTAFRGEGAFLNGVRLNSIESQSDYIGVSSGYLQHLALRNPGYLLTLRQNGKFRILGSQALHLCYVASGRFKACINYEAKIWDDIAGALIIEESGGYYCSEVGFSTRNISLKRIDQNLQSAAFISKELIESGEFKIKGNSVFKVQ